MYLIGPISAQIKIDAEIGPIKYIGALAVDVGLAKVVDVEAAVRWVIIIIIFVFDPLAVLMLVAANQSFAGRFPTLMEKPKDIIDLERPDLDLPPVPTPEPKSNIIDDIKKKYETQLKEWQEKLAKFNEKAPKPEPKSIEIIPIKEEEKQQDTVSYVIKDAVEITTAEVESEKKRPEEVITQHNETPPESGRSRPNFTEVIEPEATSFVGRLGQVFVKKKSVVKAGGSAKEKLDKFHKDNGPFQDASVEELRREQRGDVAYVQNEEQQDSNGWSRIAEVRTPEQNDVLLSPIPETPAADIHAIADAIKVEPMIAQDKITKHKIRMLTNDEYRRRIEDRINDLITKIEKGEIKLLDLSPEDQQVIIGIMNNNE
jgi:hypothetical protein